MTDRFFKYWGKSPMPAMPTVRNNYFMIPSYGSYCFCNGGNNRLFGLMAMLGFMNNIQTSHIVPPPRYEEQSFYPGLYLNNNQYALYEQRMLQQQQQMLQQQQMQNDANDIAVCQQVFGSEFNISQPKSNGIYIARSKDGKIFIEATSPEDLYEKLKASVTSDGTGNIDNVEETDPADNNSDITVPDDTVPKQNKPLAGNGGGYPEGWITYNDTYKNRHKNINNDTTVDYFLDIRNYNYKEISTLKKDMYEKLKQDVIKNNPSCFDKDGKVKLTDGNFNWDKLELPDITKIEEIYGLEKAVKCSFQRYANSNVTTIKKPGTNTELARIYGVEVNDSGNISVIKVEKGPLKGEWVLCGDDMAKNPGITNRIKYKNVISENGRLRIVNQKPTHLVYKNNKEKKDEFELQVDDNGFIKVKINDEWIPFEEAIQME